MAVLFITHKFPPSIGGMQKQSYELINGVKRNMKSYTIIQSPLESKLMFALKLKSRVKKMLKNHKDIKLVHCNDGFVACLCAWISNISGVQLTATIHGLDVVFPNKLFQKITLPRLKKLDKIFAVSDATAQACIDRGFEPSRVTVIKNGIDLAMMDVECDPNFKDKARIKYGVELQGHDVILSIGRVVKRKGFSWFAKNVVPELSNKTKYIIIGSAGKRKSIFRFLYAYFPLKIIHQLALVFGFPTDGHKLRRALKKNSSQIVHLDKIPFEDLIQFIKYSDILVMPNQKVEGDMEGFGLVALEAALNETFVIASGIEGITSAITHNKNGKLIPPLNPEIWKTTIINLLADKEYLARKSSEAQNFTATHFSWKKMTTDYQREMEALMKRAKSETKENVYIMQDFAPQFG